jgi:hypothetical protein
MVAIGETTGVFQGSSDLFFPKAGAYDINLDNSCSLEQTDPRGGYDYGYGGSGQGLGPLQTFETRTGIEAPSFGAPNLAFRRLYYTQLVTLDGPITSKIARSASGWQGTLTNGSTMTLNNMTIAGLFKGTLAPGQTLQVSGPSIDAHASYVAPLLMTASVSPDKLGPQIGKDVSADQEATLKTFLPVDSSGAIQ